MTGSFPIIQRRMSLPFKILPLRKWIPAPWQVSTGKKALRSEINWRCSGAQGSWVLGFGNLGSGNSGQLTKMHISKGEVDSELWPWQNSVNISQVHLKSNLYISYIFMPEISKIQFFYIFTFVWFCHEWGCLVGLSSIEWQKIINLQ